MNRKKLGKLSLIMALLWLTNCFGFCSSTYKASALSSPVVVNHLCTKLDAVPTSWINSAKSSLHIAYGHTSHGSQLITGMEVIHDRVSSNYSFNSNGSGGAMELRDTPFSSAFDLGNPNFTEWDNATRSYLKANPVINVVVWSWCGEVSWASSSDIDTYLSLMNQLENDFPGVKFVYMTGHTDGSGLSGTLHVNNDRIREYCSNNNKILFDFEDIESYNPDGVYFGDKNVNDGCDYSIDGNTGNWALEWQNTHAEGRDWFDCSPAHTQALNGNLKGYAAWYLWARLAGWGGSNSTSVPTNTSTPTSTSTPTQTLKSTSTPTIKPTATATPTATSTQPTVTVTASKTPAPTQTPKPSQTVMPTYTSTHEPTQTVTVTPTSTSTVTSTVKPTPTATPTTTTTTTTTPTPTSTRFIAPTSPLPSASPEIHTLRIEGPEFVKDSFISEQEPNTNFGSYQYIDKLDRFAIKFNLPESLNGKRIIKATISFYVWNQVNYQQDQYMRLYELRRPFDDKEVTWNQAAEGINWTTPGGDYDINAPIAAIPHLEGEENWNHTYYPPVDITDTVKKWTNDPQNNYGLILANEGVTDIGLKASEYTMGMTPYLSVEYTDMAPQYTIEGYVKPDFDCSEACGILKGGFKVELEGTDKYYITDSDGYFRITDVPNNLQMYYLKVSKPTYVTRVVKKVSFSGSKAVIGTADNPVSMWVGDFAENGAADNVINMIDIIMLAKSFNSKPGDSNYNELMDVNKDEAINLKDIVIIAKNFNKSSADY